MQVLIVHDTQATLDQLGYWVNDAGSGGSFSPEITTVSDKTSGDLSDQALELIRNRNRKQLAPFDVAIVDLFLTDRNGDFTAPEGVPLLQAIKIESPSTHRLLVTARKLDTTVEQNGAAHRVISMHFANSEWGQELRSELQKLFAARDW